MDCKSDDGDVDDDQYDHIRAVAVDAEALSAVERT